MAPSADSEVEAFKRRFWWMLAAGAVLLVLPLLFYAIHLDRRLDSFENALHYRSPDSTQEATGGPDLEHLTANAVQGQTVYVPVYSHIYHENGKPTLLTITLSVRNTSLDHEIVLKSVRYFDTQGKQVKSHLAKPLRLPPLATTEFLVERDDATGGSGANFLVEWVATEVVHEPIIEAVMIDTKAQQGISFARSGTVIQENKPQPKETSPPSNP